MGPDAAPGLVSKDWNRQLADSLRKRHALRSANWRLAATNHLNALRSTSLQSEIRRLFSSFAKDKLQSIAAAFQEEIDSVSTTLGLVLYAIQKYNAPPQPKPAAKPASSMNMWLAMDHSELSGLARKEVTTFFDDQLSGWENCESGRVAILALAASHAVSCTRML